MSDMGCRACASYNRGAGTKQCLRCPRYKEICNEYTDRETIRVRHYPSAIMDEVADRSHMGKGMLWAIRKLDTQDMAIALLKFYGEITVAEIAEGLKLSERTVAYRLKGIHCTLKNILCEVESGTFED